MRNLGRRLRSNDELSDEDLDLLARILACYEKAAIEVQERLVGMGQAAVSRYKTIETMRDKLRRETGMPFFKMQDIGGARVVIDGNRLDQDELVQRIVDQFSVEDVERNVVDRREHPSYGYRAVHVIVTQDGLPIEVQVRTGLQDTWAQAVERFADRAGRGLRYGEVPASFEGDDDGREARRSMWDTLLRLSQLIDQFERSEAWNAQARLSVDDDESLADNLAKLNDLRAELWSLVHDVGNDLIRVTDLLEGGGDE